jgi:hypothetical protein
MVPLGLVYSIHDSTEIAIKKMIETSQRMLKVNSQGGEGAAGGTTGVKLVRRRGRRSCFNIIIF